MRAKAAIPDAWRELVARCDGSLIESVSRTVEARTGLRPYAAEVLHFLSGLSNPTFLETVRTSESHPGIGGPSIYPPPPGKES